MATQRSKRGREELMTWCAAEGRWRKRRNGKSYAVSPRQLGFADGDRQSSRIAANEWWLAKRKQVDESELRSAQVASFREAHDVRTAVLQARDSAARRDNYLSYLGWNLLCRVIDKHVRDGAALPPEFFASLVADEIATPPEDSHSPVVAAAIARLNQLDLERLLPLLNLPGVGQPQPWLRADISAPSARTIRGQVDDYLAMRKQRMDRGKIKPNTYDTTRACLEHFAAFVGEDAPISVIDEANVVAYFNHVLATKSKKGHVWGASQQRRCMVEMKQFVRRLYRLRIMDQLPRNIAEPDNELSISLPAPKIDIYTNDEIAAILANSSPRYQLVWLLCLNCGFTQQDASDLAQDEVDWAAGRIIRKRGKTKQHQSVPVVNYLLWPETFALLKQFRSDDPRRVILNTFGKPIRNDTFDGKLVKRDSAKEAFKRLTRPVVIKTRKVARIARFRPR